MEVKIFNEPVDGMLCVKVSLYEFTDDKGKSVDVEVWVPDHDSRGVCEKAAKKAAIVQLKRALDTLESEIA